MHINQFLICKSFTNQLKIFIKNITVFSLLSVGYTREVTLTGEEQNRFFAGCMEPCTYTFHSLPILTISSLKSNESKRFFAMPMLI